MHLILLSPDSRYFVEAQQLDKSGKARVCSPLKCPAPSSLQTQEEDQVLLGANLVPFYFKGLLEKCKQGELGDLRILAEDDLPDVELIGFRARPWLRGFHLAQKVIPASMLEVQPAPIFPFSSVGELIDGWGPPPVRFTEQPCSFPPKIQIQTTTACQENCSFCPHSSTKDADYLMSEQLLERLIEQCSTGNPDSIELYFHADPLTDPRLERISSAFNNACPQSLIQIIVHESALTAARAQSLAAAGVDVVFVSLNPRRTPSVASIDRRVYRIARLRDLFRMQGKQVSIVSLGNFMAPDTRQLLEASCRRAGLPLELFRGTSRAGDVDLAQFSAGPPPVPIDLCERPFTKCYIKASGQVALCCEDWNYQRILGNVGESSIADIWNGAKYRQLRRELLAHRPVGPCVRCDYT